MSLVVLTQAELSARMGGDDELALVASRSADLDEAAVDAISSAITDVSADIEGALSGLGLDYTTTPAELKAIGVDLVVEKLYKNVHTIIPADIKKAADEARAKLKAFGVGQGGVAGATPAQQEAARFTWSNGADEPATDNPRQTTRSRMRRLP